MTEYRGQGTADAATATTTSILRETATATSGQTVFNLSSITYTPGLNELSVYVEGVKQLLTTHYTETSSTVVTFVSGVTLDDVVEFVVLAGGQVVNTGTATNVVFTHDNAGAEQTTVAEVLDALALELATDLKTIDGDEVQRAITQGGQTANDGKGGIYYWDSTSTATDTSATTASVVQQTGVTTGRWVRLTTNTFTGDVTLDDDLIVDGTTESTSITTGSIQTDGGLGVTKNIVGGQDLVLAEQADHSSTPGAGFGYLWTKNTAPSTLFFTDDTGADTDISAAGGTVTVADEQVDTTTFPMFSNTATGSISAKTNAALTYNAATNDLGSTTFTGALVGNADTATTAATVTTAAQPTITSLGTLTTLEVDNVRINGNTLDTTSGNLTLAATGGQISLNDATVVTGDLTATGTLKPTGDTSPADAAAIGQTASEGLILTGQGSVSDITIKNDDDSTALTVPTGTTHVKISNSLYMLEKAAADTDIGANGQIWVRNDTPNALMFTDDAGTDFAIGGSVAPGVPTLAGEVATTSGTNIDITGIPSWAKRITVQFVGVSTSGTNIKMIQIGDSGGFETTGYLSVSAQMTTSANTAAGLTTAFVIRSFAAADVLHGAVTLTLEDSTNNTWVASGILAESDQGKSITTAGSKSLSGALTQVRVTTNGGTDTFDAGEINILYD